MWGLRKIQAAAKIYRATGIAPRGATSYLLAVRNLWFASTYYARLSLLFCRVGRKRLQRTIDVVGLQHLVENAASRGTILVAPHLGDFDLAVSWLSQVAGLHVAVPVARLSPAIRGLVFDAVRVRCGFQLRRGPRLLEQLSRDLQPGSVVILMIDRRAPREGVDATFFHRRALVSKAPGILAAACDAGVMSATIRRKASGRRELRFGVLNRLSRDSSESHRVLVRALIAEIEPALAASPEQWHLPANVEELPWRRGVEA